jgi:hypothetical protein
VAEPVRPLIWPSSLVPVVEGHGEVFAVPILIRRIVEMIDPERFVHVHRPIRVNRGTMLKAGELERYVDLARLQHEGDGAVLVLLDADDDCPADLGPKLLDRAQAVQPGAVSVVAAMKEFEAWFLAAAESLAGRRGLSTDLAAPPDPEGVRDAKGWLQSRRTDGLAYSPTIDQPALTAVFDLEVARAKAPSLDKLCREIERLLGTAS